MKFAQLPVYAKIILLSLCLSIVIAGQPLDMKRLQGLKPRAIGPAGMSGRVTAIDVVLKNPDIIYVGTASGGLWRSTSGGIHWEPLFDRQPTLAIGAVAIDQSNPDVIWVGTGEGNPRNSQSSGNGVYKSLDGGKTWQYLGLEKSRNIHRILIDPRNSDHVYLGVQGPAWGLGQERGVYKTTDGGKSWRKILYVDQSTGIADLIMDPSNPNKLFAAMWQFRRWPWYFQSGGAGSGLYVSLDGGETWKARTHKHGLPQGELGRIGLAIARNNPGVVYALVESQKTALYRSEDGGIKWQKTADHNIGNRPFYYAEIYVDPSNENRVYNLYSVVTVSQDGGKSFETLIPWNRVHPDHHAWWIHPNDPDFMIDGNDGGLAITRDRGKNWRFVENLPLAQFYHIAVDMEMPYNILGGMQDNGSWRGPSRVLRQGGIRNSYWEEISFGDGFDVVPDPQDSRYGYSMWQGGNLMRYNAVTGDNQYIRPVDPAGTRLRFNWNAGIAADPFDEKAIYYGSQYLHRSPDQGNTWQILSPDLTTNNPERQKQKESGGLTYDVTNAENYTSIISIAPSPLDAKVIWVGTDDGNVQITGDGGASWNNVVSGMKGAPADGWVAQIRASTYAAGSAFVVINNYRQNDWAPYVYYTENFGKSWRRLTAAGEFPSYALSVVQDPVEPGLLFLGTEFGLYISVDFGKSWQLWKAGYPAVSTIDLVIHPRDHDLVVGTFGRAAYVLDDITVLREITAEKGRQLLKPLHLFTPSDAHLFVYRQAAGTRFAAESEFAGDNRPFGALLTYSIDRDTSAVAASDTADGSLPDSVTIDIMDMANENIRTFKASANFGVNRAYWPLNRRAIRYPNQAKPKPGASENGGVQVLPGTYKIRISFGEVRDSSMVTVKFDPRISLSQSELETDELLLNRAETIVVRATAATDRIREAQHTIKIVNQMIGDHSSDESKALKRSGKTVADSLKSLLEQMIGPQDVQGIYRDASLPLSRIRSMMNRVTSSWEFSAAAAEAEIAATETVISDYISTVNQFFEEVWQAYRQQAESVNPPIFDDFEPLK